MFVCFLDTNNAFVRVDYSILFRKLITRKVPAYILRLLWNWHGHHYARIQWAGIFPITLVLAMVFDRGRGNFVALSVWSLYR